MDLTELLERWSAGEPGALDRLMSEVYEELKRTAHVLMEKEKSGHSWQTTELVHEAYLRLVDQRKVSWQAREQFFAFSARLMRRILIDRARARQAAKRGGNAAHEPLDEILDEVLDAARTSGLDLETLLALDQALANLLNKEERLSTVVELRYFAGMNNGEIAQILGISKATVKRDWAVAQRFLARELSIELEKSDVTS